jgi:hypothetical protein
MVGDTKRLLNPWSFIAHLAAMSRVNVLESRINMTRSCSAGFCPRVKKNYQGKKLFLCIIFLWPREYRENDFVLSTRVENMAKFGYIFRRAFLALNFSRRKSGSYFMTRRQEKVKALGLSLERSSWSRDARHDDNIDSSP